jgi:hypothetical protein
MATVPKTFADDFTLVARYWIDRGQDSAEGVAEIKDAIRIAFNAGGKAVTYWQGRIADEAAFIRELHAMGAGLADRIKATAGSAFPEFSPEENRQ